MNLKARLELLENQRTGRKDPTYAVWHMPFDEEADKRVIDMFKAARERKLKEPEIEENRPDKPLSQEEVIRLTNEIRSN